MSATRSPSARGRRSALILALPLLFVLALPLAALAIASSPQELMAGFRDPRFGDAIWLSLRTSVIALSFIALFGTPLAWWLAGNRTRARRAVELLVDVPIVLPPAVVGLGLLVAFGRNGPLGGLFEATDLQIPFTTAAVVLAQVVVGAPFFVQTAAVAFRRVDPDMILAARTLGASPRAAFVRVVLPLALPGLVSGLALAWARALGEFGATLLFAGNLRGVTQTMPVAIYTALESDVRTALVLALALLAVALLLLFVLRAWSERRDGPDLALSGGRR